jgi:hypothetical protein
MSKSNSEKTISSDDEASPEALLTPSGSADDLQPSTLLVLRLSVSPSVPSESDEDSEEEVYEGDSSSKKTKLD